MRPDGSGPEQFVKISELEKKNTKKRLMFKELDDFPEDEDEFEEDSKAVKLASTQKKVKNSKENTKKEKVINQEEQ